MIPPITKTLWLVEAILTLTFCLRVGHRYPITSHIQVSAVAVYGLLACSWWQEGISGYLTSVEASRPLFRLLNTALCIESVLLMARGIPRVRYFAAVTSMVFAGLSAMVFLAGAKLIPAAPGLRDSTSWAMACVVYLVANYWLYSRGGQMDETAERHAIGAMVMMFSTAVSFWLASIDGRGGWIGDTGQVVGRVGPIVALSIWMRKGINERIDRPYRERRSSRSTENRSAGRAGAGWDKLWP